MITLQKQGGIALAAMVLVAGMATTALAIESFQERVEWGDMSKPTTIQGRVIVLDPYDEAVWINVSVFGGNAESGLYWQKVHPGKNLKFYAEKGAWEELKKMGLSEEDLETPEYGWVYSPAWPYEEKSK